MVSPSEARKSALLLAVYSGHYEVVRTLLEAGADPTSRDSEGISALQWAKRLNYKAMAKLIKKWIDNWNETH